jgi:hypothetical protein
MILILVDNYIKLMFIIWFDELENKFDLVYWILMFINCKLFIIIYLFNKFEL